MTNEEMLYALIRSQEEHSILVATDLALEEGIGLPRILFSRDYSIGRYDCGMAGTMNLVQSLTPTWTKSGVNHQHRVKTDGIQRRKSFAGEWTSVGSSTGMGKIYE